MVQFVEDIELIAYHSCQPMGRGLCSKSRAAGAPRASRGLVLPREAWTRKTSPFFATCQGLTVLGFRQSGNKCQV